jgi:hypothetical protein
MNTVRRIAPGVAGPTRGRVVPGFLMQLRSRSGACGGGASAAWPPESIRPRCADARPGTVGAGTWSDRLCIRNGGRGA